VRQWEPDPPDGEIYTVSRLNRETRLLLFSHFASLWVEGEISNLAQPSSGHWYFTLKDSDAQVRCAMFRPQTRLAGFTPRNGDHVLVRAQVGLYEPRGDFQLVVESMEPAGDGALQRAFEALKRKLAAEGLFDAGRKQPLPRLPKTIGVITSPSGAAIRDILTVLKRRFPAIPVVIYPARVQGADAPGDLRRALSLAVARNECDVLILARGGGSLEDLCAFNDEALARAVHACPIPLVSGVGHEIDFTIADFVADLRAPTPSAAAEAVSPDRTEWLERLARLENQIGQRLQNRLAHEKRALVYLEKRLWTQHPARRLQAWMQRLDELEAHLRRALRARIDAGRERLAARTAGLQRQHPARRLIPLRERAVQLHARLRMAMRRRLEIQENRLDQASRTLETVSPLGTLNRGYAIARRRKDGHILRDARDIQPGERMETRLASGAVVSIVEKITAEPF
jgi:exodeoxyribonuclease VII large subunit